MKACRMCKRIIENEDKCPACGSDEVSDRYSGLLVVIDAEKSEIAKIAEVHAPGRYAVKVK